MFYNGDGKITIENNLSTRNLGKIGEIGDRIDMSYKFDINWTKIGFNRPRESNNPSSQVCRNFFTLCGMKVWIPDVTRTQQFEACMLESTPVLSRVPERVPCPLGPGSGVYVKVSPVA